MRLFQRWKAAPLSRNLGPADSQFWPFAWKAGTPLAWKAGTPFAWKAGKPSAWKAGTPFAWKAGKPRASQIEESRVDTKGANAVDSLSSLKSLSGSLQAVDGEFCSRAVTAGLTQGAVTLAAGVLQRPFIKSPLFRNAWESAKIGFAKTLIDESLTVLRPNHRTSNAFISAALAGAWQERKEPLANIGRSMIKAGCTGLLFEHITQACEKQLKAATSDDFDGELVLS